MNKLRLRDDVTLRHRKVQRRPVPIQRVYDSQHAERVQRRILHGHHLGQLRHQEGHQRRRNGRRNPIDPKLRLATHNLGLRIFTIFTRRVGCATLGPTSSGSGFLLNRPVVDSVLLNPNAGTSCEIQSEITSLRTLFCFENQKNQAYQSASRCPCPSRTDRSPAASTAGSPDRRSCCTAARAPQSGTAACA